MANEALADAFAAGRPATCKIDSLDRPVIELLSGNAVAKIASAVSEVELLAFEGDDSAGGEAVQAV